MKLSIFLQKPFPHYVAVGAQPDDVDIAFTSIGPDGAPGLLTVLVMVRLGYSPKSLPLPAALSDGYFLLQEKEHTPVMFIVTVTTGKSTMTALTTNLQNALAEHRTTMEGKSVWIPLMGTGVGRLDYSDSYKVAINAFLSVWQNIKLAKIKICFGLPDNESGHLLFTRLKDEASDSKRVAADSNLPPAFTVNPDLPNDGGQGRSTANVRENESDHIPFHLDNVEDTDRLNREPIAKSLARLINNEIFKQGKKVRQSFMINLQGSWGDGKSTFMNLLKRHLPTKESNWVFVEFNAWQNQHINPPWWIFMDRIYQVIQRSKGHKRGIWWKERWWRLITLQWSSWIPITILFALFAVLNVTHWLEYGNLNYLIGRAEDGKNISGAITSYIAIISALWLVIKAFTKSLIPASSEAALQFQKNVRDPMSELKQHFASIINYTQKNVAVFIDDLDRCNAPFTVAFLEGIQTLFKDQPVLYVVAGDRRWISTCF
jgi:hypothetical protein